MKNKVIISSIISALVIMGFAGITNASFGNVSTEDRESHRTVINKLMDGETLTSDEQTLLEEMKVQRAEHEIFRTERQAQKEELAPIMEKKRAGEKLTETEQTKLDEFRAERQGNGNKMGGKRGGKGGNRGSNFEGNCGYSE